MERTEGTGMNGNTNDQSAYGDSDIGSDQASFQAAGAGAGQSSFQNSGLGQPSAENGSSASLSGSETESGLTGRVKGVASSVKDKASNIPSIIADGLQAGAKALRQNRGASAETGSGAVTIANDSSVAAVTDTLASGMESSAEWLRDADVEKLKAGVEKQVKEHPGRTLLVALGAGYLLGKAFRR